MSEKPVACRHPFKSFIAPHAMAAFVMPIKTVTLARRVPLCTKGDKTKIKVSNKLHSDRAFRTMLELRELAQVD